MITQVIGGVGVAIGIAVGALLTKQITGSPGLSGLAQSSAVVGGALLAIPVTRLMTRSGRRPGLMLAYAVGVAGALLIVAAAATGSSLLAFAGMFCFGGGTAANLQARYAAVDLAEPARRGWQLSIVVWATTVGSVAGPNLAAPADRLVRSYWSGMPDMAGPFVFSALAFGIAGLVLWLLLRPDPLLLSRELAGAPAAATGKKAGMRVAFRLVMGIPGARLGLASAAIGHLVMVGVMSMTPIYIEQGPGHSHADVLNIVGIVLSIHIAGMYALSPIVGWATDKLGRRPVVITGIGLLLAACAVSGTADHGTPQLAVGLGLLGLGWSCTMISGSTLLAESVPLEQRPVAQGLSDLTMGLAGAGAGALAGLVVQIAGYPILTLLAAVCAIPVLGLALRGAGRPDPVPSER